MIKHYWDYEETHGDTKNKKLKINKAWMSLKITVQYILLVEQTF